MLKPLIQIVIATSGSNLKVLAENYGSQSRRGLTMHYYQGTHEQLRR